MRTLSSGSASSALRVGSDAWGHRHAHVARFLGAG